MNRTGALKRLAITGSATMAPGVATALPGADAAVLAPRARSATTGTNNRASVQLPRAVDIRPTRSGNGMRAFTVAAAVIAMFDAVAAEPAAAQSGFGDAELSYDNGVVYDDDLVPGRSIDTPFLVEGAGRGTGAATSGGVSTRPESDGTAASDPRLRLRSRDLIGADGRLRN